MCRLIQIKLYFKYINYLKKKVKEAFQIINFQWIDDDVLKKLSTYIVNIVVVSVVKADCIHNSLLE